MSGETHLPGGAEDASHGTASLGAQAGGITSWIAHQNGLDGLAILEAEEEFASEAVSTALIGGSFREIDGWGFLGQPASECRNGVSIARLQPDRLTREPNGLATRLFRWRPAL